MHIPHTYTGAPAPAVCTKSMSYSAPQRSSPDSTVHSHRTAVCCITSTWLPTATAARFIGGELCARTRFQALGCFPYTLFASEGRYYVISHGTPGLGFTW